MDWTGFGLLSRYKVRKKYTEQNCIIVIQYKIIVIMIRLSCIFLPTYCMIGIADILTKRTMV